MHNERVFWERSAKSHAQFFANRNTSFIYINDSRAVGDLNVVQRLKMVSPSIAMVLCGGLWIFTSTDICFSFLDREICDLALESLGLSMFVSIGNRGKG